MMKDEYFKDFKPPRFIALPKPGQSIDDDDCLWTSLFNATVREMTIFLLHEPAYVDEKTREKLAQMVNLARAKAKAGDNFFEALGCSPGDVEKWRTIPYSELTEPEDMA